MPPGREGWADGSRPPPYGRARALPVRHRTIEFRKFLVTIDSEVLADLDGPLVSDNYGTHKTPATANCWPTTRVSGCHSPRPIRAG